jgi:hypothetical protein
MSVGFDGFIYYNSGSDAVPTWVEIDTARDVSTSASADKADNSDRRSKFKKSCAGMLDLETTVTATFVAGDTALLGLRTHFLARTTVQIAVMDGPYATSGSEGFKYFASVYSNDFSQPLNDGQTISVTFSPSVNPDEPAVEPSWVIIA